MVTHVGVPTFLFASFGSNYAGLGTVGYTLKRQDLSVLQARTTTGVVELGNGDYGVAWTPAAPLTGYVEWDTGTATPTVAREDITVEDLVDSIGGARVVVAAPVAPDSTLTTVRGDDYNNTDGRALEWTDDAGSWPTLTGATVALGSPHLAASVAGTVVVATGAGKKVRVELPASATAGAVPRVHPYDVQATLTSGRKVTLARGNWYLLADYA